jgi:hypothetical protein
MRLVKYLIHYRTNFLYCQLFFVFLDISAQGTTNEIANGANALK